MRAGPRSVDGQRAMCSHNHDRSELGKMALRVRAAESVLTEKGYSGRQRERDRGLRLKQGDEMGRFLLGSTVVLLFPRDELQFNPAWAPGRAIRLGEAMVNGSGG